MDELLKQLELEEERRKARSDEKKNYDEMDFLYHEFLDMSKSSLLNWNDF